MKGLRLIRLLALLAVTAIALVAVALTVLSTLDLSGYRGVVEARVGSALGRTVTLAGPIHIRPSLRPTLTVRQVAVANPAWATHRSLAEAERLTVELRLAALLRGHLQVERVTLTGAHVHLETHADGRSNWLAPAGGPPAVTGAEAAAAGLASLPDIEVASSQVDYRNGRSGLVTRLTVDRARLHAGLDEPLELTFVGTLRGQALSAGLIGGPLVDLLHGEAPWPLRVAVLSNGTRLQAQGELRRLPEARFDLAAHLSGADFTSLDALLGVHLPPLGPFELEARLVRSNAGYRVSDVRGFLGAEGSDQRFSVQAGGLEAPADAATRLNAEGRFRDLPFQLTLTTAPYARLLGAEGTWPLNVQLRIARTDLSADGTVQPAAAGFSVDVRAAGADVSTLEPLLGRDLPSVGPYELSGRFSRSGSALALAGFRVRAGGSDLRGDVRAILRAERPEVHAELTSDALDMRELRAALAAAGGRSTPDDAAPATVGADGVPPDSQRPLPAWLLREMDGELSVRVGVVLGLDSKVEGLRATMHLRDARLHADDVRVRLAGQRLNGSLEVRADGPQPAVRLRARGTQVALEPLLSALHITRRLAGQAERLDFSLRGQGTTLQAIWQAAALRLEAGGGTLVVLRTPPARDVVVDIATGWASTGGGDGLELEAVGHYRTQSFTVRLSGDGLPELVDNDRPWHARASGTLAGVQVAAQGTVREVFRWRGMDLQVHATGERLSALNTALGTDLPDLGPYTARGRLTDSPAGVSVTEVQARLGESDFTGQVRYASQQGRARILAQARSTSLRIADLRPSPRSPGTPRDGRVVPALAFPVEALRGVDLDLSYTAAAVQLANGAVHDLSFEAHLRRGNLAVEPLTVSVWNGTVTGSLALDARGQTPRVALSLAGKKLDYARALGGAGKVGIREGTADVAVDLRGSGATLREALAGAQGTAEFLGGEGRIDNELLNLWASDLLLAMLPSFGKEQGARLRCATGHFDVADGRAETRSLLVDMDRLIIKGNGTLSLKDESLDFLLWPEARDPSLISVTTPVRVTGTLADPSVSPQARGVVEDVAWLLIGAANPFVLLVGLVKPGALEDNPCVAAMAAAKDKRAQPDHEPPTPYSKVRDWFKGVGRFFERTFSGGGEGSPPAGTDGGDGR